MTHYETLGIRPVINAYATLTRLGGSIMPPEVVQAMQDASHCFVDLPELQLKVGQRIAQLTQNEAAYISSGAAAGINLATVACSLMKNELNHRFPVLPDKFEVIVHKTHRNGYDYAIEQLGVKMVEIGDERGTRSDDLHNAINEKTIAVFWFQGIMTGDKDIPLTDVIDIANQHNIPVIVDAAAQLPPAENLWNFTKMGATLAIFSGGKDLRGPQSSGLVLGKSDYIEIIRQHANPNHSVGRPLKVGKEEMLGLLAAVERYLDIDHEARLQLCEDIVQQWCQAINQVEGVVAERDFPNEAGQPLPWCLVTIDAEVCGMPRDEVVQQLWDGNPAIAVSPQDEHQIHLNPTTLEPDEEHIVLERLLRVLQS